MEDPMDGAALVGASTVSSSGTFAGATCSALDECAARPFVDTGVALASDTLPAGRSSRPSCTDALTRPPTSAAFQKRSVAAGDQTRARVIAHASSSSTVLWMRYVSSQAS